MSALMEVDIRWRVCEAVVKEGVISIEDGWNDGCAGIDGQYVGDRELGFEER